ncbi:MULTISPECIES: ABC transporter permease [Actinomadura]|uniref:Transport permease protein n=1 Tax=Actinomadura litoris TaxID=2678616 RepID=A0A7K1L8V7_9ACTN|nr:MULTISPECIES: ABC transporter permease [Actinomadura]MBT2213024.1 ABC transporter permease [Actinomadura sp. NEAU-AAG7]MUN40743.1 ABC transporter permease [Actinomadura litoris]
MSHPERLGSLGGESVGTIAEPPHVNDTLAAYAARYGLKQSAARPTLRKYIQDVWARRNFIWAFASAKNISMYTESRLGQLWQLLTPILNVAVYFLIFGVLLSGRGAIPDYLPFLVTGVFMFGFTQRSITSGSKSVGTNLSLIRALHFPRATLPLAIAVVELQQLLLSLVVLLAIVVCFGEPFTLNMLLFVPVLMLQLMFNIGASLVVARIGAFNRDITQLLPFIMRTWLYLSGVIFSLPSLMKPGSKLSHHPWAAELLKANPGYVYVELSRNALLGKYRHHVQGLNLEATSQMWLYGVAWAVIALVGGFLYFYRAEERYGRG